MRGPGAGQASPFPSPRRQRTAGRTLSLFHWRQSCREPQVPKNLLRDIIRFTWIRATRTPWAPRGGLEVEEVEDEEIEVEEEEEPPPVLNYRAPPRESPLKPVTPVTPTVEPVASNETKEEAPRNAHRWGVLSGTTSSTPIRSAMAARQDDTLPATSRFVSLPSLKPRQPQPRSSSRHDGSNESSPPSKQLVNEKLPPLSGRGTPTSVLKNQLAAVAYGDGVAIVGTDATAGRSRPTDSSGAGSQQSSWGKGARPMIAMISTKISRKDLFPRELVARKKAGEEGPAPKKAQQLRKKSLDGRPVRSEVEELGATLEIGWRCITSQDKVARATALTGEIQDAQGRMGPIAGS